MSSGLDWSEDYFDFSSTVTQMLFGRGRGNMAAWAASVPVAHPPDTFWKYSSGTSLILSGIVRRVLSSAGVDPRTFPRVALFDRIGMRSALVESDASGTLVGSSFSYATARDWARFGYLYLRDGVWERERILPEGWVDYSRTPTPTAPLGNYGAHFWLNAGIPERDVASPRPAIPSDAFYASGFEGQVVVVIPSHDLVVVRLGLQQNDRFDPASVVAGVVSAIRPVERRSP
jgi:CubicO group peptidase (beta-lactamase class C family)